MEWYWILLIVLGSVAIWAVLSIFLYRPIFKRFYDFLLSFLAILILTPAFIVLVIVGLIAMKGNPFFVQKRPGKKEKIFSLIKFRSMTNKKDSEGKLLPDNLRINGYGKFIRKTSLDELPELFNIFLGNMSFVGPRPLLVEYLPYYTETERHRHDVRPGLTGLSQVHGRNFLSWEERFDYDLEYIKKISIFKDIKILFQTVIVTLKKDSVADRSQIIEDENGNKFIIINGVKKKYPKALNIERGGM